MKQVGDSEPDLHCQTRSHHRDISTYPLDRIFSPFPNSRKISLGTPFNSTVVMQAGVAKHLVAPLSINAQIVFPCILADATTSSPSSKLRIFLFCFSFFMPFNSIFLFLLVLCFLVLYSTQVGLYSHVNRRVLF